MNRTGIEWCDWTWNPIVGCSPVSEGCKNCYAKRMARRLAANPKLPELTRGAYLRALSDDGTEWVDPASLSLMIDRLDGPSRVKKPGRVFVCSMSDLGHVGLLRTPCQAEVISEMFLAPWHTYIVLTKRPGPWMRELPKECWVGVTAENQARADERIPELLLHAAHAAVRFVCIEPMLGPVDFRQVPGFNLAGSAGQELLRNFWVIAGPETGPGARECRAEWIGALADQCRAAGVPFFDKRKKGTLRREWPTGE